jgi:hypothetical protein
MTDAFTFLLHCEYIDKYMFLGQVIYLETIFSRIKFVVLEHIATLNNSIVKVSCCNRTNLEAPMLCAVRTMHYTS